MKFKKLLISASAIAAGSGLLATVISCAKADIDEDLRVELDAQGKFTDSADYKSVIRTALTNSSSWVTFKETLAKEIIYEWFVNRASTDKNKDKNDAFKNFLDKQKYNINDEYKQKVDSYKSKYGANYKFYLQNELLAKNGGTEEAYKHKKLVDAVKDEFVNRLFTTNYFAMRNGDPHSKYPHMFTKVIYQIHDMDTLRNPANWERLGFFAKANSNFNVDNTDDPNKLAEKPDGDYATIQNYIFNRWFKTEKPFFSAAALIKYAKPKTSGADLKTIYNDVKVTVPDAPNEAFPFFGTASDSSNGATKGNRLFYEWFHALTEGEFEEDGIFGPSGSQDYNKTISIPVDYSDDGQTLLLCYGNKMIDGTDGTLYTPYAISAASLYNQMFSASAQKPLNSIEQDAVLAAADHKPLPDEEIPGLLQLFCYKNGTGTLPTGIKSYIDLANLYDGITGATTNYHSSLFKENKQFTFFYGKEDAISPEEGVRYVTNNVQVDLVPTKTGHKGVKQPWILELNEAGMHAQTIDGYQYVTSASATGITKEEALKQVVMYRLMENQCGWDQDMISESVFSATGDLKKYFDNNFANIILEMAYAPYSTDAEENYNVFRTVESYKETSFDNDDLFLNKICLDQKLGTYSNLVNYLKATKDYDDRKKNYDAVVAANKKIYSYRTTQITNSKLHVGSNTIYENGMLAPIAFAQTTSLPTEFNTTHFYNLTHVVCRDLEDCRFSDLGTSLTSVKNQQFVKQIDNVPVDNKDNGFSPQIKEATKVMSNRFWFTSAIIDQTVCTFMDSNLLSNEIKTTTYGQYEDEVLSLEENNGLSTILSKDNRSASAAHDGIASTYISSKLLTSGNNFANYALSSATDFYAPMWLAYTNYMTEKKTFNTQYCDEALNEALYFTTLAYLAKNDFENYYKQLDSKIAEDQRAIIGYLGKYNAFDPLAVDPSVQSTLTGDEPLPYYRWQADIGNIFDDYGYTGGQTEAPTNRQKRLDFDGYWNVVTKDFSSGTTPVTVKMSGFLGIQTPSNNQLDEKIKAKAFDDFALSTYKSIPVGETTALTVDEGVLFPWAGTGKTDDEYKFDPLPAAGRFAELTFDEYVAKAPAASKKLAKKFYDLTTAQDIRTLAGVIGKELTNKSNKFTRIANGEETFDESADITVQMKQCVLRELMGEESEIDYAPAFKRLANIELRNGLRGDYCFENSSDDGYKLMFTQINKSDVKEHTLSPTYQEGTWVMNNSGVTLNEFWYILASMANEPKVQEAAITDAVKVVFKDKKLVVHDAQLYNQFDSIWIKDWEKKPIGGAE